MHDEPLRSSGKRRRCIALLSGTINDTTLSRYRGLVSAVGGSMDVVLLLTDALGEAARALAIADVEILRPEEIFLPDYGEKARSRRITPGNTDLVMMAFFRRRPWYEHVWMVEYDVLFPHGADVLARLDTASDADLILSTGPSSRRAAPKWYWWHTLTPEPAAADLEDADTLFGLFCVSRYGARLFAALEEAYRAGWSGHHECAVPTIARRHGLAVENLNKLAERTIGTRLHFGTSFSVKTCSATAGALLYHPVKTLESEARLREEIAGLASGAPGLAVAQPAAEALPQPAIRPAAAEAAPPQGAAPPRIGPPRMLQREVELFRAQFAGVSAYCEFGMGGSTLLAVEAGIPRMVSVESDKAWLDAASTHPAIQEAVQAGRLTLLHGDIGPTRAWGAPADRASRPLWPGYSSRPWATWGEAGRMPELVLVDGRFRVACCLSALQFARSLGVAPERYRVVLHDFSKERAYYEPVLQFFDIADRAHSLIVMQARPDVDEGSLAATLSDFVFDQR